MSAEDLEKYETEMELQLYREYRDVVGLFTYVVETERRFYLTNDVDMQVRATDGGEVYFEVTMADAWVWDMYRPARFVKNVRVADVQGRQRRGARQERPRAARASCRLSDWPARCRRPQVGHDRGLSTDRAARRPARGAVATRQAWCQTSAAEVVARAGEGRAGRVRRGAWPRALWPRPG